MNIIISGALGMMGRVVGTNAATLDISVKAGIDREASNALPYPVYAGFENCPITADVIIDFSHPSNLPHLLAFAKDHQIPAVIATTGMSETDIAMIHEAGRSVPIFFTFNMSLGVNLLCELAKHAAAVLGKGFDVEIIEKHHNKKIDAPSGTAIMLANAVTEALPYEPELVYDRHAVRKQRAFNEIGMHSIRGGTMTGEHEVAFCGMDEVITLTHTASSKSVFAIGALKAAAFLNAGKIPGVYDMKDLVEF
ncbi:MAG TPA: 4-hydroxy-tetrahydrodipicolinate reductase [Clostridia bacterium]|nr:4-hydroxy-tetrahydrodipicolinate reductase [Clostridia bacterium]